MWVPVIGRDGRAGCRRGAAVGASVARRGAITTCMACLQASSIFFWFPRQRIFGFYELFWNLVAGCEGRVMHEGGSPFRKRPGFGFGIRIRPLLAKFSPVANMG